jgi:hypothetical protein
MTDLRTAAQQALAHVQEFKRRWMAVPPFGNKVNKATREAVTLAHVPVLQLEEALRAALAQQEQEPVAWQYKKEGGGIFVSDQCPADVEVWNDIEWSKPLYTHPPRREWQSLTDEDIGDVFQAARNAKLGYANDNSRHRLSVVEIARAVEAALKERNT